MSSFLSKFKQLFSGQPSNNLLGISLRQNSLAYCFVPTSGEQTMFCKELPLTAGNYVATLAQVQQQEISAQCHLVLSGQHYQMVQIDRPDVPAEELAAALKWQVKDLVTIPPENMVVDYFDGPLLAGGKQKLNVVCATSGQLKEMIGQINRGQLNLASITTEEFAFAALLPKTDEAQLLLCQQPNEDIFILIVKQGRIFFHRHVRGMAQIGAKSKEELGFGTIDSLSLEIQKSLDYFERQLKQPPIKGIKVIVPIELEAFLAAQLSENANVPVELLRLPEHFAEQRHLAAAVGATLLSAIQEAA